MASAHEIAANILRAFSENIVLRRSPWSYGQYAQAIGKNSSEYGLAIGKAMHAIGALCVVRQIPVAPLYWVRRADNGYRGIFENDQLERQYIIESGDIDVMYVVSREYIYQPDELDKLSKALDKSLSKGHVQNWSPHDLWHLTFQNRPKDSDFTFYERAMIRYRRLYEEIKLEKAKIK